MKGSWAPLSLAPLFALMLLLGAGSAWAAPTITITGCSPSTTVVVGQTITCTAKVSGGTGGTVSWQTSPAGSGNFNSTSCTLWSTGSCAVTYTPTSAVSTTLTASYPGATSATQAITVSMATPGLSLSCSPSGVTVGSTTNCTAQLTNGAPNAGGSVNFSPGTGTGQISFTSTNPCPIVSASCTVTVKGVASGTATVQAVYSGDSNDNSATATPVTLTVSKAAAITSVVCSPADVIAGDQTTCTATVKGYSPTGTVTWTSTDSRGVFSSNPCTLSAVSSSTSSCGITYTAQSSATITGSYSGDSNNAPSVGTFAITATVNEEIQITVANGGPYTPVALSGCSVSPTTIQADGQAQTFSASSGCTGIVVTLPPAQAYSRYLTSTGQTSLTIGACSSNSCQLFSATIYYQVFNTYQASPESPAVWSTSGYIQVNGTVLGAANQRVCSITVSTGAGQFSCQGWSDYGTQTSMGPLPVSANQRWGTGQGTSSGTTGGNVQTAGYYLQVLEFFEYRLVGSVTGPAAPSLDYTAFGGSATIPLVGSTSPVWLDSGSGWKVPVQLSGSSSTERWQSQVTSGAAAAGQNVSLSYYHQYFVSFAYRVTGGGAGFTNPGVSFSSFGASSRGNQTWADAGSTYSFTDPLAGSTANVRWASPTATGLVSGAGMITAVFFHQFAFDLNFTVMDGGSFSNPLLTYVSMGSGAAGQLNQTQGVMWLDSGSSWSVTGLLPSSTPTEQWVTDQTVKGTATGPISEEFVFFHQYLATLSYTIVGTGGSPPVPAVNYTSLGAAYTSPLNKTANPVWVDATSAWSVPATLQGVSGERWLSSVTNSSRASAPFSTDVRYTHQFYVEVASSSAAGGFVGNSNEWKDQGSSEVLSATAAPEWRLAYWQGGTPFSYNGSAVKPTLTVVGPANETAMFYPSLTITSGDQGSVAYAFAGVTGTVPPGSNVTVYAPPGKNITLTAEPTTVTIMFSGWSGALTGAHVQSGLVINSPSVVKASFATDYPDIRVFAIATLGVLIASIYVFVARRGYSLKLGRS